MTKFRPIVGISTMTLIVGLTILVSPTAIAQGNVGEIFLGYAYAGIDGGSDDQLSKDIRLHGYVSEFSFRLTRRFAISGDFGAQFGSLELNIPGSGILNPDINLLTFMGGARFYIVDNDTLTVSASAHFGVARFNSEIDLVGFDPPLLDIGLNESTFATLLGMSFDWNVSDHVGIRVVQPSVLITTYNDDSQYHFRFATGVVFRY